MKWESIFKIKPPFGPSIRTHVKTVAEKYILHEPLVLRTMSKKLLDHWFDIPKSEADRTRRHQNPPKLQSLSQKIMVDAMLGNRDNPPSFWAGFVEVSKEEIGEHWESKTGRRQYKRIIVYDPDKTFNIDAWNRRNE